MVLDQKCLQEHQVNTGVSHDRTFCTIHQRPSWWLYLWYCYLRWWYYFLLLLWSGIWFLATTRVGLWTWISPTRHCRLGHEFACLVKCWKIQLVLFDQSNSSCAIEVKMVTDGSIDGSVYFLRWQNSLSPQNWIATLALSPLLKLPSRKLQRWFVLQSFFLTKLLLDK